MLVTDPEIPADGDLIIYGLSDKYIEIDLDVLPESIVSPNLNKQIDKNGAMFTESSPIIPFEKLKEEAIKHALDRTNGNVVEAARKLNIGRATMYRLMEKYSLDVERR